MCPDTPGPAASAPLLCARPHLDAHARDAAAVLDRLQAPDVRALAALVSAPSLIAPGQSPVALLEDHWRCARVIEQADWLAALDRDPRALEEHLARSNARQLGRYAEALWHFWFIHLPGAVVHAAGLAIREGAHVRGELDFVLSLPGLPGVQHLETGYKFYLRCPSGEGLARLVGTNPEDRLDRKWRHMLEAQLPLSQSALARMALPADVANVPITPRACLQGHVFEPYAQTFAADGAMVWCRHGDDPGWLQLASTWVVVPRRAWIPPVQLDRAQAAGRLLSREECMATVERHFAHSAQAEMVAGVAPAVGLWREVVRVLVVARDWPN